MLNQTPPFGGLQRLFESDPLLSLSAAGFPDAVQADLTDARPAFWGTHEAREFARLANRNAPELERYDARASASTMVEFPPGLSCPDAALDRSPACIAPPSTGARARRGCGTGLRAARYYMTAQTECGHLCPITMTNASLAALRHAPDLLGEWAPRHPVAQLRPQLPPGRGQARRHARHGHDGEAGRHRRARQHHARRTPATAANTASPGTNGSCRRRCPMRSWCWRRPSEGLTCFLMPRILPDGTGNGIPLAAAEGQARQPLQRLVRGRVRRRERLSGSAMRAGASAPSSTW